MTAQPFRKYHYGLNTLSTVVLSPRDHQGFYLDAGDFTSEDLEGEVSKHLKRDVNIIYPFYRYGTYSHYAPTEAQYYIPGSSIKGALSRNFSETEKLRLMVDDIRLNREDIQLYHLMKVQRDNDKFVINEFFPNVAVEMLCAGKQYTGELFCEEPERYFRQAHQDTINKLQQLVKIINSMLKQAKGETNRNHLQELKNNVEYVLKNEKGSDDRYLLLLGGYKGLSLSVISNKFDEVDQDGTKSAIYFDEESMLPHGLVEITLEQIDA